MNRSTHRRVSCPSFLPGPSILNRHAATITIAIALASSGCRPAIRNDLDYSYGVVQTFDHAHLDTPVVQFETVDWNPGDSTALEELIVESGIANGRSVLEVDTGTGVFSLLCAAHGAKQITATDKNPAALANAQYNAALFDREDQIDVAQEVRSRGDVFSSVPKERRFDLILVDLRHSDATESQIESLVSGLSTRLIPGGRCLVTCGNLDVLTRLQKRAEASERQTKLLGDVKQKDLPEEFPQGVLVELR